MKESDNNNETPTRRKRFVVLEETLVKKCEHPALATCEQCDGPTLSRSKNAGLRMVP